MSSPPPTVSNEELMIQALVDLIAQKFIAAFGDGRGCSRGVPVTAQMPEECPWAWVSQGESSFADCANGYPTGLTDVGIAVRVFPTQSDQDAADTYGQRAVWMMVNQAKWILDQLLLPPLHMLNGVRTIIRLNGKPNRYWGEDEAWLSYPLQLEFDTGLDATLQL